MEQELSEKFLDGDKKTIDKMIEKFTTNREENIKLDGDVKSKHLCNLCYANIKEDNLGVCGKCSSQYQF